MRAPTVLLCILAVVVGMPARAAPPGDAAPPLSTNQAYLEDLAGTGKLAIGDPMAVFAYVFDHLPEQVKVYPTENHYYFSFNLNGVGYAGNIKIDAQLREQGQVAFAYFRKPVPWLKDSPGSSLVLGPAQGVNVEKLGPLAYRVRYAGKSVVFALNDLSGVRPPAGVLAPGETFIGPVFDESGVRFFLVFDRRHKLFHYILDETVDPADTFAPAPVGGGRILIGARTGFALYRDRRLPRKLLIGAYAGNVSDNNYFDGPFDQMPDNFIDGDAFRQAILSVAPELAGKINRFGSFSDGARYAIETYMEYRTPKDLAVFDRCATDPRVSAEAYEACFSLPLEGDHGPRARPLAMKRRAR
jgi:hypothetical protein